VIVVVFKVERIQNKLDLGVSMNGQSITLKLAFFKVYIVWGEKYSWVPSIPKRIVVAGSHREYTDWLMKTNNNPVMFQYVTVPYAVTGLTDLEVYYVGNFRNNPVWLSKVLDGLRAGHHIIREVYEQ
jgi:hypothetical protein